MDLFGEQFYPTPQPVIEKMVAPFVVEYERREGFYMKLLKVAGNRLILDPEAGRGDILDFVTSKYGVSASSTRAIEIDLELRLILTGKGYRVIGSDFLEYEEPVEFGLILANPPFATGVKHALRIWDFLSPGGDAAILLNRETVDNPYTKERELLGKLIADHGSVEYLGQCFQDSDRPTDVEVALVRLKKPPRDVIDFSQLGLDQFEINSEEFSANPLASRNAISNLVARYKTAIALVIQRHEMQSKLDWYLDGIASAVYDSCDRSSRKSLDQNSSLEDQVSLLKSRFWNTLFTATRIGSRTTSSFAKDFDSFASRQAAIDFTERNIYEVLGMFFQNMDEIMVNAAIEVWDKLCAYHEKNKIHTEGWKTNKGWKLNKKVIHPYGIRFEYGGFSLAYGREDIYNDLDKVLCWLAGVDQKDGISTVRVLNTACNSINKGNLDWRTTEFESYFFKIRIYKKGTVHLVFKDLKLLEDYNKLVAGKRNWIGDGS